MRAPRAAWLVAALLASSVGGASGVARADDKLACSRAYDQTQALRRQGRLLAAREQAAFCTRDACADFIRTDCAKWLGEITASQPTVVFEARDGAGKETSDVRVDLDGKPWIAALDGKAKPVDPGPHVFHYVRSSGESVDDTVQIREGEKNRKLTAPFKIAAAPAIPLPVPPPPVAPPAADVTAVPASPPAAVVDAPPERSVAPWIIGGVGLAAVVTGAILGGIVVADHATTQDPTQCSPTTLKCTPAGLSAANQGRTLGPVSTVMLVAGGVGVAVGAVWLIVRSRATTTAPGATAGVAMGPVMTPGGAGFRIGGSW